MQIIQTKRYRVTTDNPGGTVEYREITNSGEPSEILVLVTSEWVDEDGNNVFDAQVIDQLTAASEITRNLGIGHYVALPDDLGEAPTGTLPDPLKD